MTNYYIYSVLRNNGKSFSTISHQELSLSYHQLRDGLLKELSKKYESLSEQTDLYGQLPFNGDNPFTETELRTNSFLRQLWQVIERTPELIIVLDKKEDCLHIIKPVKFGHFTPKRDTYEELLDDVEQFDQKHNSIWSSTVKQFVKSQSKAELSHFLSLPQDQQATFIENWLANEPSVTSQTTEKTVKGSLFATIMTYFDSKGIKK